MGKDFYDNLQPFSLTDTLHNEKFIKKNIFRLKNENLLRQRETEHWVRWTKWIGNSKERKINFFFFFFAIAQAAELRKQDLLKMKKTNSAGPRGRLFKR